MITKILMALSLACAATFGQQANDPATGKDQFATVEGKAVGLGGQALKKATVTLRPFSGAATPFMMFANSATPGSIGATTDAEGKFHFDGVPPGRYYLSAEKPGFLRGGYGATTPFDPGTILTLAAGKDMKDLTIKLTPTAIIAGKVVDEDGDPIANSSIRLSRLMYRNGKKSYQMTGFRQTDANGEFKLDQLTAGKYYLAASKRGMFGGQESVRQAGLKTGQQEEDYVTTYYPGSTDQAGAQAIEAIAGQEILGLKLTLKKLPVYHLRGKVVGSIPGKPLAGLKASAVEAGDMGGMTMMVGGLMGGNIREDGTFDLGTYPAGSYIAQVTNSSGMITTLARQRVELGHEDKNDIVIALQPLGEVVGKVEIELDPKEEAARAKAKSEGKNLDAIGSIRVQLTTQEPGLNGKQPESVKDDGTFVFTEVGSGLHKVNVMGTPLNSYIKAITVGGRDVMTSGIEVNSGQVRVDVKIAPGAGQVSGTVSDGTNPVGSAVVTLVPEPFDADKTWMFKSTTTDQAGAFSFRGLTPGKYKVYAWQEIENGAHQDPDFLRPWGGKATDVEVKESSANTVTVVRISAADMKK